MGLLLALRILLAGPAVAVSTVDTAWQVAYTRTAGGRDTMYGAAIDASGNTWTLTEGRYPAARVRKVSPAGALLLSMEITPPAGAGVGEILPLPGGDFIVGGEAEGASTGEDLYLARYTPAGSLVWEITDDEGSDETVVTLALDSAGNILVGGWVGNPATGSVFARFTTGGAFLHSSLISIGLNTAVAGVAGDGAGNAFAIGTATLAGSARAAFVVKVGAGGAVAWTRTYDAGVNGGAVAGVVHIPSGILDIAGGNSNLQILQVSAASGALVATTWFDSTEYLGPAGIATDTAGNIYVAGQLQTKAVFDDNCWLTKYTPALVWTWSATYDSGAFEDPARVGIDPAGNAIIAASVGRGNSCGAVSDLMVRSYAPGGSVNWTSLFDTVPDLEFIHVGARPGGGAFMAGDFASRAVMLTSYAADGALQWERVFSTAGLCEAGGLGGAVFRGDMAWLAIGGNHPGTFDGQMWYARYDGSGTLQQAVSFSQVPDASYPESLALDGPGNLFASTDYFSSTTYEMNQLLVKFDTAGNFVWGREFKLGPGSEDGTALAADGAGNAYYVGTDESGPEEVGVLVKFDPNGNQIWKKTLAVSGKNRETRGAAVDGDALYLCGMDVDSTGYHAWAGRYDLDGNKKWEHTYLPSSNTVAVDLAADSRGGVAIVGIDGNFSSGVLKAFAAAWDAGGAAWWTHESGGFSPDTQGLGIAAGLETYLVGSSGPDAYAERLGDAGFASLNILATEGISGMVYPSPVAGDSARVALALKEDATEVVLDVYNSGFQRVFSARWRNVRVPEAVFTIEGIKDWAPGRYLIRGTATLQSGATQVLAPVKLVVKR